MHEELQAYITNNQFSIFLPDFEFVFSKYLIMEVFHIDVLDYLGNRFRCI